MPIVRETKQVYDRQSSSISHAQKLRQLQGVLTHELLSTDRHREAFSPHEVVKDIGLTNDAFVASILNQRSIYDKPVVTMPTLLQ